MMKGMLALLTAALFYTLTVAPASAADTLTVIESNPEAGATLDKSPRGMRIWFDALPAGETQVSIKQGDTVVAEVAGVHSMGENDLMGMLQTDLPDGDYELSWMAAGSTGSIPFSIKRPDGHIDDKWAPPLDIGIVLYDGAEPIDVFGPLEMWMNAGPDNIRVHLIAEEKRPIVLTTTSYPKAFAPRLNAQYSFEDAPELDVLMVPGGIGTLVEVDNPAMINFLKDQVGKVAVATSVCTGSALYAKAGLLDGVKATGNKVFFDYIVSQGPADWQLEARWVESGRFLTSSGVTAGMDMSLAVIARFFGIDVARMIAASTEYEWNEDADRDPFAKYANTAVPYVDQLRERWQVESAAVASEQEAVGGE
ncbi:MAG: DJ-1/PfpI family protein [Pseudomonadota bacterium]